MVFKVLFAAITQTITASATTPMVEFLGGQADQVAWVKSIGVFGLIGLFFLALNVLFFVRERVEPAKNQENFREGLKIAVTNKYWLICVLFSLCINMVLDMNLFMSVC